jgi:hypothetical protein
LMRSHPSDTLGGDYALPNHQSERLVLHKSTHTRGTWLTVTGGIA